MNLDSLKDRISAVREIYNAVAEATAVFAQQTQIGCKSSCAACCMKPRSVWASIGEMLPMAWQIYNENRMDAFLKRLQNHSDDQLCALLNVYDEQEQLGRCSEYAGRPLLCRLFGSSSNVSKDGQRTNLACKWQKEHQAANQDFDLLDLPTAGDWVWRMQNLHPEEFLQKELPINEALKEALQLIDQIDFYSERSRRPERGEGSFANAQDDGGFASG